MSQSVMSGRTRAALLGAAAGGAATLLAGAAASGAAAYFARKVITPERVKPDDVKVLAVGEGTVTMEITPETVAPGQYGLWFAKGRGHLRLGPVVEKDVRARTVTRVVDDIDVGAITPGPARWSSYYYAGDPASALGLRFSEVSIDSEVGPLKAWVVPPSREVARRDVWAVLIHGHGGNREEALRALPLLHRLGIPSLVPSYRNDVDGPQSGRLGLGATEWCDVEASVLHALNNGAQDVILFGWSMGGAIVLQHVSRSWTADRVRAVVLDSPVIDWNDVLDHQVRINNIPKPVGDLSRSMISDRTLRWLSGLGGPPIDFRRLDWVSRACELRLPVLLMHSDDDEFVPSGPSRRLARARPDLVTYVGFAGARHCKEWNTDPARWEREVARFLLQYL